NKQARDHLEASEWLEELFKTYRPDATPAASKDSAVEPQLARKLVFELCAVNFRYQLMGLDELANTAVPTSASSGPDLLVSRANHRRNRLQLIDTVCGGVFGDPFEVSEAPGNVGIACERWSERFVALKAFWTLMDTWPGEKHALWNRGNDPNISQMQAEGEQWERLLVHFYVQTYYNLLNYPPILPRRK
ncbi:hypothetical protein V5O48_018996, partial [Marasmius crinis-equi]